MEFTRRVLRDFAFWAGLRDRSDDEAAAALRAFIAALGVDVAGAVRADDTIEVERGEVRLVFSADQARVIGALWPREQGQAAGASGAARPSAK